METKLFSSFALKGLTLSNRIVMAPMTRSRAIGNVPNDLMAEYYSQRASAGLIVTEGTSPSPNGLGYPRIPGIFNDEQAQGWSKVTKAVHAKGGRIFVQMMHTGRIGHPANLPPGAQVIGPSAIMAPGQMWTDSAGAQSHVVPKEMTEEDIQNAIREFVHAAKLAVQAGFDGIELHSANGYLLNQFLNKAANQRTDRWGGTAENRARFVLTVAEETAKAIGSDKVGIRISPYGEFNTMEPLGHDEEYLLLAKEFSRLGLSYVHVIDPGAKFAKQFADLYPKIRSAFSGAMILAGDYSLDRGERDLREGKSDMIAFGRPFISNPDFVTRLQNSLPLAQGDHATFYTPGEKGYTDYPTHKKG